MFWYFTNLRRSNIPTSNRTSDPLYHMDGKCKWYSIPYTVQRGSLHLVAVFIIISQADRAREVRTAVIREISGIISSHYDYHFPENLLKSGVFRCRSTQSEVTYRNTITSSHHNIDEMMGYIEDWVKTEPIVQVGDFHLIVNKNCSVHISSMNDPECFSTELPAATPSVIASSDPVIIDCLNECLQTVRGEALCSSP